MTYSTATRMHTATAGKAWSDRAAHLAARLAAAWAERRRRRQAMGAVSGLSDRTLADLGVTRAELQSIVHFAGADRSRRARGGDTAGIQRFR